MLAATFVCNQDLLLRQQANLCSTKVACVTVVPHLMLQAAENNCAWFAGGPFFDPLGFSRGDKETFKEYQEKEVKNGRLAMLAFLGFFAQYAATGESHMARFRMLCMVYCNRQAWHGLHLSHHA